MLRLFFSGATRDGRRTATTPSRHRRSQNRHRRPAAVIVASGTDQLRLSPLAIVYRLMCKAEYNYAKDTSGRVGSHPTEAHNFPRRLRQRFSTNRNHLSLPQHVADGDSEMLTSYTACRRHANEYTKGNRIRTAFVRVTTARPPVFTVPSHHFALDPDPFNAFNAIRTAELDNRGEESFSNNSTLYPTINTTVDGVKEICGVNASRDGLLDFRPLFKETIIAAASIQHRFFSARTEHDAVSVEATHARPWAIKIYCPESEQNLAKMMKEARKKELLARDERFLTIEDTEALFPILEERFPLVTPFTVDTPCILKSVPAHLPAGSPEMVEHCSKLVRAHYDKTFSPCSKAETALALRPGKS